MFLPGFAINHEIVEVSNFDIQCENISTHQCNSADEAKTLAMKYVTSSNICMTYCTSSKRVYVRDLGKLENYFPNKPNIKMYFWGKQVNNI